MDLTQVFIGNVSIYLGRGNIGVAKHALDTSEIGAVHK